MLPHHKNQDSTMSVVLRLVLASFLLNSCLGQEAAFSCCTEYPCKEKESCPSGASGCATRYVNGEIVKRGCILQELVDCYKEQDLILKAGSCVDTHFFGPQSERFKECERNIGGDARIYKVQITSEDEDTDHKAPSQPHHVPQKIVIPIDSSPPEADEKKRKSEDDMGIDHNSEDEEARRRRKSSRRRKKRSHRQDQTQDDSDFGLDALTLGRDKQLDKDGIAGPGMLRAMEQRANEHRVCFCEGNLCNKNGGPRLRRDKAEIFQLFLFVLGVVLIGNH